ncbi:MarR family transcriptional regulator [Taibaiella chishuiensis]|uniref:MarR family transcriptional regulator n=2 Tax=Taibaiella chishuiensis TaxID=1434707 RepID=A0A2P8D807_9BACT|nr:MarR family transcriptional regulator [Taibaiella chishuiensis]
MFVKLTSLENIKTMKDNAATGLRDAVSDLHKRLRRTYSAEGFSISELTTLSFLYRHPFLYPTELAQLAKVKSQSMSAILKKLEAAGLTRRRAKDADGRRMAISLTAAGRKMVDRTRYERDEWLSDALLSLSTAELAAVKKAIPLLQKIAAIP